MSAARPVYVDPREVLRAACRAAGGQNRWARLHEIDDGTLSKQATGQRPLSDHVISALGLERITLYRKRD